MDAQVVTPDAVAEIAATLPRADLWALYQYAAFLQARAIAGDDDLAHEFAAWETASEDDAALFY